MNTVLPAHVQRQLEEANAIEAQLAQEAAPPASAGTIVPAAHTLESGTVVDSTGQPRAAAEPAAEPETPPVAAPAPAPVPPEEDFKHKYKTIQGMYNSHVPKLQAQVKELSAQLEQMKVSLEKPAAPQKPAVDPKDAETFGADLVDMVLRVTESRFSPLAATIDKRLSELESKVTGAAQVSSQTADQVFFATLARIAPDWELINADSRFLDWLEETDPVYGEPRQMALDRARQLLDAQRAANVFLAWKALVAPPPAPPVLAPPPRPSLEAQVAPRAVASQAPAPAVDPLGPVITSAQISRFYDDVARGRYRGREQEAAAFEAQINQAVSTGRVR